MYKPLLLFLILTLCCCKNTENKLKAPNIEIKTVLEDSINIRALEHTNGNFWFAGSNGKFGFANKLSDSVTLHKIDVENNLEFRSIATTPNYTYILTAGNPALIYKISLKSGTKELIYTENGEAVFYDSMKFWNDDEGIALGDPQKDCFTIIKTMDGGKTWRKLKCDSMPDALSGEAAFAASNSNLKIIDKHVWFVTGGSASRIFHSSDKGETWNAYETPIISGQQMTGIYATDFFDENLGVIVGGDWNTKDSNQKNKAITYDGGKTWQLMSDGSGAVYCSDVIFIPETQGKELLAVGSPGVWWSGNQGKSWTKLSEEGYYTVEMISATEGYFSGRHRISKFKLER